MLARTLAVLALAALVVVPIAGAHGNPAGEALLSARSFVPPDTGIATGDRQALDAMLRAAARRGYPLRVAVIATRFDLGEDAGAFRAPQHYVLHLSNDLAVLYKGRVLVATPSGYAIARDGKADPADQRTLDGIRPPASFQGAVLAAAVERTVRKLAAAHGVVLAAPPPPASGGSSTGRDRLLIAGAAVLVILLAVVSSRRRRARSAPGRRP